MGRANLRDWSWTLSTQNLPLDSSTTDSTFQGRGWVKSWFWDCHMQAVAMLYSQGPYHGPTQHSCYQITAPSTPNPVSDGLADKDGLTASLVFTFYSLWCAYSEVPGFGQLFYSMPRHPGMLNSWFWACQSCEGRGLGYGPTQGLYLAEIRTAYGVFY